MLLTGADDSRLATEIAIYKAIVPGITPGGARCFHPHAAFAGNSPSFTLFMGQRQDGEPQIRWWCHRNGHGGTAWKLLMLMLGTNEWKVAADYFDRKINEGLWTMGTPMEVIKRELPTPHFKDAPMWYDLAYYNRLGIPTWKLELNEMLYLRKLEYSDYTCYYATPDSPMVGWRVGAEGLKVYRPHADRWMKHRNLNLDRNHIDGLSLLKTRVPILYILSSRKDRMIVDDIVPVVNGSGGENNVRVWRERAGDLLAIADKIVVLQDGDAAGWEGAQKIAAAVNNPRCVAVNTQWAYPPSMKDMGDVAHRIGPRTARGVMEKIHAYVEANVG